MQVHSGRDDGDLVGPRAVELAQLGGLVARVGGQCVGVRDDGGLAELPAIRLAGLVLAQRGVLHPGHGVHGVHPRPFVPTFELPGDQAGKPVVRVEQCVVVDDGIQLRGELGHEIGKHLLGDHRARSGWQGDDPGVLVDLRYVWGAHIFGPGEDVHLQTPFSQPARHLGDVDVEPPGVADPRSGERRGVHADHGHAQRESDGGAGGDVSGHRWRLAGQRLTRSRATRARTRPMTCTPRRRSRSTSRARTTVVTG